MTYCVSHGLLIGIAWQLKRLDKGMNKLTEQLQMVMRKFPERSQTAADLQTSKKKDDSDKLLNLLKKTQMQVSSLENEIERIEAENVHQDRSSQKDLFQMFVLYKIRSVNSCLRQRIGRVAFGR